MISHKAAAAERCRRSTHTVFVFITVALVIGLTLVSGCSKQSGPAIDSIAVLPLENATDDADEQYFACGVTESVISRLGRVAALKVIAWPSVMQLKNDEVPATQVASDLDVQGIVRGSVLQTADAIRVSIDITNVSTGETVSSSVDGQIADIRSLENKVALAIIDAAGVKLNKNESGWLSQASPVKPEAYRLYLRGQFVANQRRVDALQKSIGYFSQAIEADPGFAPAYVGIADADIAMGRRGFVAAKDAFPQAEEMAKKALAIDPSLPGALSALAYVNFVYEWQWEEAKRQFEEALALDPGSSLTRARYVELLDAMDMLADAMDELEQADDIDPQNPYLARLRGLLLFRTTNLSARYFLERSLELEPDAPDAHVDIARWFFKTGQYLNGVQHFGRAYRLAGWSEDDVAALEAVFHQSGALAFVVARAEMVERMSANPDVMPLDGFFGAAEGLAMTSDRDAIIATLEKCRAAGGPRLVTLTIDPYFHRWKTDSVFVAAVSGLGIDIELSDAPAEEHGDGDHHDH